MSKTNAPSGAWTEMWAAFDRLFDEAGVDRDITMGRSQGCICPVGAEKTCQGTLCPRRPISTEAKA